MMKSVDQRGGRGSRRAANRIQTPNALRHFSSNSRLNKSCTRSARPASDDSKILIASSSRSRRTSEPASPSARSSRSSPAAISNIFARSGKNSCSRTMAWLRAAGMAISTLTAAPPASRPSGTWHGGRVPAAWRPFNPFSRRAPPDAMAGQPRRHSVGTVVVITRRRAPRYLSFGRQRVLRSFPA